MTRKRGKFWGGSEKQSVLELRWRRVADCYRSGFQPPEMHDRQQHYLITKAAHQMLERPEKPLAT